MPFFSINFYGPSWLNPGPSWPPPLLLLLISSLEPLLGSSASLNICNPDLEQRVGWDRDSCCRICKPMLTDTQATPDQQSMKRRDTDLTRSIALRAVSMVSIYTHSKVGRK